MASVIYNAALAAVAKAVIDLDHSDIRAILVMTNTTADTDNDAKVYVGDLTTLDECDATGYARIKLTNKAVTVNDGSNLAFFDADDLSFTGLGGNATRDIQGVLLYKHVSSDADSPILCFIDFVSDVAKESVSITVPWNAAGILSFAQA